LFLLSKQNLNASSLRTDALKIVTNRLEMRKLSYSPK
jgi:hypothetical protein